MGHPKEELCIVFTFAASSTIMTSFRSVLAAKNLGDAVYDNFLDHTFLGDRKTSIREYLATNGYGIMEEEPPELLQSRYGG